MTTPPFTLLLVEPDADARDHYIHLLDAVAPGYVLKAATADEAVAHCEARVPAGVFLSAILPGGGTHRVAQHLHDHPAFDGPIWLLAPPQQPTLDAALLALVDGLLSPGPAFDAQLRRTAARLREHHTLQAQHTRLQAQLEALQQDQTAFFADHRHALRNPLNAVLGYSELVTEALEDAGHRELLPEVDRIRQAGRRLLELVDALQPIDATPAAPRPAHRAETPPTGPPSLAAHSHRPDRRRRDAGSTERTILIIDDDPDVRDLMAQLLAKEGYHPLTAADGAEGLRLAWEHQPDAITIDVIMPVMDGWAVLGALKAAPTLADIPVIMVTGQGSERTAAEALKLGVNDYLIKGEITAQTLRLAVEGVVEQHRLRREVEAAREAREEANAALRESERRYRLLAEHASDMISRHTLDGTYRYVSPAAQHLFGYAPETLIGQSAFDYLHPDDLTAIREARTISLAHPDPSYTLSYRLRRHDDTYVWVETTGQLMQTDGEAEIVAVTRDITERKQAEQTLAHHAEELARSNRDLDQFASVASHDLQEPLRAVNGYLRLLQRQHADTLPAAGLEKIDRALDRVAYMQQLVTDLLAYARLNARGLEPAPVDLNEVLQTVLGTLGEAIQEAGATVSLGDLPLVHGDHGQLSQVFQNLLSNALKFHREGVPPLVEVAARCEGTRCHVTVTDNGIGIDPAYAERIFGIFHRLNPKHQYPGTGIGLSICQRIVERHQGRIRVAPAKPHGAVFTVSLPRPPDA